MYSSYKALYTHDNHSYTEYELTLTFSAYHEWSGHAANKRSQLSN